MRATNKWKGELKLFYRFLLTNYDKLYIAMLFIFLGVIWF